MQKSERPLNQTTEQTEHWLRLIRDKRDSRALNHLMRCWQTRVYNLALKMVYDHDLAMEVMQKTFIKVYHNAGQLQDLKKFKPWLYRIAVNYCKSELRSNNRLEPIQEWMNEKIDKNQSPQRVVEKKQLHELMMEALQKIPTEQKEIIIMKEYEGLKFQEIADTLDISINTAKSRLYYGLKALKKILITDPLTKDIYYEVQY